MGRLFERILSNDGLRLEKSDRRLSLSLKQSMHRNARERLVLLDAVGSDITMLLISRFVGRRSVLNEVA